MNFESIEKLSSGSEEEVQSTLSLFNDENVKAFSFPTLTKEMKQNIMNGLLSRMEGQTSSQTLVVCLSTVRILSREKDGLNVIANDLVLKRIVKLAGLDSHAESDCNAEQTTQVTLEAQKCLCNIVFNSLTGQKICSSNGCVEGIVHRMKAFNKQPPVDPEVKFFDMRLLFLITALCAQTRPLVQNELNGTAHLIDVLDSSLQVADGCEKPLTDADVDLACEVLKILFNVTLKLNKNILEEDEEAQFTRLVGIIHGLLTCSTVSKEKKQELISHSVNLLTNMPRDNYEKLVPALEEDSAEEEGRESKDTEFLGSDMQAIQIILDFLSQRLDAPKQSLKESLSPVLHCICELCKANRSIRKFCRLRILPFLRDEVKRLPEEGSSLRNRLCKLLTNPVTEVKHLTADLLFVLCKENVQRFVKYTGFGNAAGLLAERGLMCGGYGAEYSSPSEDSDTDEYVELQENVNPVTGRWEMPKPNPMEGMTDEQKEHEAMVLMEKLHKLQQGGIIQPMKVGPDGKPQPISHVLELVQDPGSEADHHGDEPEQGQPPSGED